MVELLARPAAPAHAAAHRGRRRPTAVDAAGLAGLGLWILGLSEVNLSAMGDTGLISVVPPVGLAGAALLLLAFAAQVLRRPGDHRRIALQLVALVVVLDGLPTIVEATAGIPTGYIHVGFSDYILRHGHVLQNYDARFSWPGMFAWAALGTVAGGRSTAMVYLRFAPLVLDLLYLLPLRLILRRCCRDPRVAWLAMAVFVLANWTEQDYFSPQGFALLAYLSVIAVVLACSEPVRTRLRAGGGAAALARAARDRVLGRDAEPLALATARSRVGVVVALVAISAALVTSHQLTPYGLLGELLVLLVIGRIGSPSLVAAVAVLAAGYLSLGAENFWSTHLATIFGGVGQVGGSVSSGVVARTKVSAGHLLVVEGRLAYSVALIVVAAVGALAGAGRRSERALLAALAVGPWLLAALQSYGGEVFIRSLLLSLPFLSALVASAAVAVVDRLRAAGAVLVAVSLLASGGTLLLTRYGNEPFYETTASEIAAVHWVDTVAPAGSTIAVLSQDLPWRYEDIDRFHFVSYQARCSTVDARCIRRVGAAYLIVTEGQIRFAELDAGATAASFDRLDQGLLALGYRSVRESPDVEVWVAFGQPGYPYLGGRR